MFSGNEKEKSKMKMVANEEKLIYNKDFFLLFQKSTKLMDESILISEFCIFNLKILYTLIYLKFGPRLS